MDVAAGHTSHASMQQVSKAQSSFLSPRTQECATDFKDVLSGPTVYAII
jgi:hypothetical protein